MRISAARATNSWNCIWGSWLAPPDRQRAEAARHQIVDPGMGNAQRVLPRKDGGIEAELQPQPIQHGGETESREVGIDLDAARAGDVGNQLLQPAAIVG